MRLGRAIRCCAGFQSLLDNAGRRGLAIVVERRDGLPQFMLQSRGVDHEDEALAASADPGTLIAHVNIWSGMALFYCPICGYKLSRLLARSPTFFSDLADQHSRFYWSL